MQRLTWAIAGLALFSVCRPVAAAAIHLDDEIAAIPAKVTDVYNCGHWKSANAEGFYRVIYIEFHYGNSLLYVQWMQDFTPENPTRRILRTISIDEFNANDHIELGFAKPKCIETEDGIRFNIEALSGHDDKRRLFEIRVREELGKFSVKELVPMSR